MANVTKIGIDSTSYDIEDATARTAINNFASTSYAWTRNTSYPSGSSIPQTTWCKIASVQLPAGTYYVRCSASMSNGGGNTAVNMFHRISGTDKTILNSLNTPVRNMEVSDIITLTQTTTIEFDVYTNGTATTVGADSCEAIKLF